MTDALAATPQPSNEPIPSYAPGSPEKRALKERLLEMQKETIDAPCVIGGRPVTTATTFDVRAPHDHDLHLATAHGAGIDEVNRAIQAAEYAKTDWAAMDWEHRAGVFLRAAELISGPWRDIMNAATMLGQSKNVYQSEIDATGELVDFLRFNVHYYREILATQPQINPKGVWNRLDYRPLEGFVLAITPFNFTAIAGNLPTAPAITGNTVVWKPSEKQALAAHYFMQILQEAGLPDGVINLVHGDGALVSDICLQHPDFAGLHFTGSITVMRSLWENVGRHVNDYRTFPRIVGETGGKDFVIAHASADLDRLAPALVRGAFEYQGQKCSAASRAYIPSNLWPQLRDRLADMTASVTMGDITDFRNFMGAVIDEKAFARHRDVLDSVEADPELQLLAGGDTDRSRGWFVEPSLLVTSNPRHDVMQRELFGPILSLYVYDERDWESTLDMLDTTSPYGLTGAVFATDRTAVDDALQRLRNAAGNFYINDKPTGSIVGQQPFGGARASGTNDKAGSPQNLWRWISTRSVKETLAAPTDWRYPHMDEE